MDTQLVAISVAVVILVSLLLLAIFRINNPKQKKNTPVLTPGQMLEDQTDQAIKNIFNDKFREELKNRGRLHFEKIITDNAMFLQQDLRLTTAQLNDYMKQEITGKLREEFSKYEQSIADAKEVAIASITKTQSVIDEQRAQMVAQLGQELAKEKEAVINRFNEHLVEIVNHYVLAAIGNQININDQLEYVLDELDKNKKAIVEDIRSGA